ncbi:ATP-binding cassette domain-containing protein [bacterium]|nr:ATP-binding cassette domain-containing protein [bacterium]
MNTDALVIDDVSKNFDGVKAVKNLSARLPSGCIYGFIGPNGAGKTTTIRMIMNIIRPDSGSISILGESVFDRIRDRIGYLPEERGLYRKMTVKNVLSYIGSIKGMNENSLRQAIPYWLGKMDLARWADKKVNDLSRGMQQKLQVIATVINNPDLVIFDEPFSGLDPINLELVKGIMLSIRESGKTVIFSTHMMEHAEKLCDYILLINKGEKVIDGTLDEIRSRYTSNIVSLEIEGDTSFIGSLPMVMKTMPAGRRIEVVLREQTDHQDFLRTLMERTRVRAFEIKVPSLHEIFIHLVGNSHEQNS